MDTPGELQEAVADARFVVLAVPLADETDGLVGPSTYEAMRTDASPVNVARRPVVDQGVLVDALQDDGIEGAALDVFDPEPLPESSPLWGTDGVVTPHCAAFTRDYYRDVAALVRENLDRIERGEQLPNRAV